MKRLALKIKNEAVREAYKKEQDEVA